MSYSILLADATAEQVHRGFGGEIARKNVELRDANVQLRGQVAEQHAATIGGVRQRAHDDQRDYQNTVRAFIEAMGREADTPRDKSEARSAGGSATRPGEVRALTCCIRVPVRPLDRTLAGAYLGLAFDGRSDRKDRPDHRG